MPRKHGRQGLTRREFAGTVGVGAAAAGIATACKVPARAGLGKTLGPGPVRIRLQVNGEARALAVEPRTTLLAALRDGLGLTGPKPVCDRGACGACTVLLDGEPVCSCLMLAADAQGRSVLTPEGLGKDGKPDPLQEAFVARDALQCGFCTPGMVMSCKALLLKNPRPTLEEVKAAVAGNLCRCGTYTRVFEAVLAVANNRGS
jgi:aerobic-type carbon monoxide dehydrogenase small subunit (CoxS/CutS family)